MDTKYTIAKPRQLNKPERLTVLQELTSPPNDSSNHTPRSNESADVSHLSIQLVLHSGRLVIITMPLTAMVVAITLIFSHGVILDRFHKGFYSPKQQSDLVDRYNSYSGNIASAVQRPLELFVAMLAQVVVLRLLSNDVLQVEPSFRARAAVIAVSAGIAYLLANGLNALNVQVREMPVNAIITDADLPVPATVVTQRPLETSVSEFTPQNPVANTILRTLVQPRIAKATQTCKNRVGVMEDDAVIFGIPQRPWMADLRLEDTHIKRQRLSIIGPQEIPNELPLQNASMAADLLILAVYAGQAYWPWNTSASLIDSKLVTQYFPSNNKQGSWYAPIARVSGLLPPTPTSTETQDREWFLSKSGSFISRLTRNEATNASVLRMGLEFAQLNLSPSVRVDAITIEREQQLTHLNMTISEDAKDRYYSLGEGQRGLSPSFVFIPSRPNAPQPVVHVFGMCMNRNGTETVYSTLTLGLRGQIDTTTTCSMGNSTAFFLISTSRWLVADALEENVTVSAEGIVNNSTGFGVITNLREVVSVTYARIGWQPRNLSAIYNAVCNISSHCLGLDADLADGNQRVIVHNDALPLGQVTSVMTTVDVLALVKVTRPQSIIGILPTFGGNELLPIWTGDLLMPHNVRNVSVGNRRLPVCRAAQELRVEQIVDNHLYSENSLQTAYTSAAYFLFQNGVAKDVIRQNKDSVTLAFDGNAQEMTVRISTPLLNVVLTLMGCAVMMIVLIVSLWWPRFQSASDTDPWTSITLPHVVARVLVNDTAFPPILLKRTIKREQFDEGQDAGEFEIERLRLVPTMTPLRRSTSV